MAPDPGHESLLRRLYGTSLLVALAVASALWSRAGSYVALSYLGGVAIGLLFFAALGLVVCRLIQPAALRPARRWPYLVLHVGKLAAAAAIIYAVSRYAPDQLLWLAAGYGTPLAVLGLKGAGRELNRRLGGL